MPDEDWVPETRPVIPELETEFEHETFPPAPVHFVPLMDKLEDPAIKSALLEMARAVLQGHALKGMGMCHTSVIAWAANAITASHITGQTVLEVGSFNVNGTVRPGIEAHNPASYIGADISAGASVDVVANVEDLPALFPTGFGLVVTTEMLEHVVDWRAAMYALASLVKRGGTLALSTRSPGFPYHAFPDDHWRYPVDTMHTILTRLGFNVDVCIPDPEAPGVFAIAHKPKRWTPTDGVLDSIELPGPG